MGKQKVMAELPDPQEAGSLAIRPGPEDNIPSCHARAASDDVDALMR
jgi:hypothetical protein